MAWAKAFSVIVLLGIAACSQSTDPHEGGLFGGISGLSSGAYDQRIQQRQAELANAQAQQAELQATTGRITAEQEQIRTSLQGMERQVADLNDQVDTLQRQLADEQQARSIDVKTRKQLEAELKGLDRSISLTRNNPGLSEQQMRETLEALRRRYETLRTAMIKALNQ